MRIALRGVGAPQGSRHFSRRADVGFVQLDDASHREVQEAQPRVRPFPVRRGDLDIVDERELAGAPALA